MVILKKVIKKGGVCFLWFLLFPYSVHAKTSPDISLTQSAQTVWQREQLLVSLSVKTDDPFARLEIGDFKQTGFHILPYDQQRITTDSGTQLIAKWAIFAFIAGKHPLQLPRIRYRPNRGRIQTLETPEIQLQVRRLPVYVPPTMPVGSLHLTNQWNDKPLIVTNHLKSWQITVLGKGITDVTLPPLRRQLLSNRSIQILPFQKTFQALMDKTGIQTETHYTVPVKPMSNGLLSFPPIAVQYFDPTDGKLKKASLSPPLVLALDRWLIVLMSLVILFLCIVLFIFLTTRLKQALKKSIQRKQAFAFIKSAPNYQQVRKGLQQLAEIEGWGTNITLTEFALRWGDKHQNFTSLQPTIQSLQTYQFSSNHREDFKQIVTTLITQLN